MSCIICGNPVREQHHQTCSIQCRNILVARKGAIKKKKEIPPEGKRFHRRVGNKLELAPENKSLRPLVLEANRVRIQGVLVGQLRTY